MMQQTDLPQRFKFMLEVGFLIFFDCNANFTRMSRIYGKPDGDRRMTTRVLKRSRRFVKTLSANKLRKRLRNSGPATDRVNREDGATPEVHLAKVVNTDSCSHQVTKTSKPSAMTIFASSAASGNPHLVARRTLAQAQFSAIRGVTVAVA
jgi:hypothetical protein